MATTNNFKAGLDLSPWMPRANMLTTTDAAGMAFAWDMRNDATRLPWVWRVRTTAAIDAYNTFNNGWLSVAFNPAISGIANGTGMVFHPTQGPRGTIAAGATTTTIVLTTALPAAVGLNQMGDRGDGTGFRLRIVDNAAGASGKTEEVTVTKNTASTTPTITFTPALTFTPTTASAYEFLSGKLYCLGSGAIGATTWKSADVLTAAVTALSQTNLAATIATDSAFVAMSELYVSSDRKPGDGFLDSGSTYNNTASKCILASASSGTTITATALTNPSTPSLATNEYRNFQIRVVEDTTAPTAVGQRRNITSHTSGNTPVFTVPVFTVTPTAGVAKFVVELNDDRILLRTSGVTNMYNYTISSNTWDASTTWAAGGTASNLGTMLAMSFGVVRDSSNNRLHGHIFAFPAGGGTILDLFDITAAATGAWTATLNYGGKGPVFTTGSALAYDPVASSGKYAYIVRSGLNEMYRFNLLSQTLTPWTSFTALQSSVNIGQKVSLGYMLDGATVIPTIYMCAQGTLGLYSNTVLN